MSATRADSALDARDMLIGSRVSLSQNQLLKRSCVPDGGSPGFEWAMSGSNRRFSNNAAASGLRAIIMISELR